MKHAKYLLLVLCLFLAACGQKPAENPPEASVPEPPVKCSKGGVKVDPDRTISLERKNGAWSVVSEGY